MSPKTPCTGRNSTERLTRRRTIRNRNGDILSFVDIDTILLDVRQVVWYTRLQERRKKYGNSSHHTEARLNVSNMDKSKGIVWNGRFFSESVQ